MHAHTQGVIYFLFLVLSSVYPLQLSLLSVYSYIYHALPCSTIIGILTMNSFFLYLIQCGQDLSIKSLHLSMTFEDLMIQQTNYDLNSTLRLWYSQGFNKNSFSFFLLLCSKVSYACQFFCSSLRPQHYVCIVGRAAVHTQGSESPILHGQFSVNDSIQLHL